ncbi:MAG: YigZ family protein [Clostridia bacterium]|nr:YigZ family protein [Clostridia bacterium]
MAEQNLTTLGKEASAEFTEKKSVFIGYAKPIKTAEEAEEFIAQIKKKHADARHNVSAYMAGNAVRYSDDGEPKGTGGVPVLEVLKKSGVDGAVVVVTRYFGGILLGAPGLVRAYSKAAAMAVEEAGIVTYRNYTECTVTCDYGLYDKLLYDIGRRTIITDDTDFGGNITLRLAVLSEEYEAFEKSVYSMTNGKLTPHKTGERYDI